MLYQVTKPADQQTPFSNIYNVVSTEEDSLGNPKFTMCGHEPQPIETVLRFTPRGFLYHPTRFFTQQSAEKYVNLLEEQSA